MSVFIPPFVALSWPVVLGATLFGAAPARPAARFEGKDTLLRPEGYREWVFVGSSLGLRYDEGKKQPEQLEFKNVYIDPAAYRAYKETGAFPQGTVLVLETAAGEEKREPGLRGTFQKEFTGLSAAVKDKERFADGWAYFSFSDGPGKTKAKAQPAKKAACYDCHREKGAKDNVFTQFYPVLRAARARAGESSWEGKAVLLTRPGVKLEAPDGEKIAPRTAGPARDLLFAVRKDEGGRLRVESRRQVGWIPRADAVPVTEAVAHFTARLAKDPKDGHAYVARGHAHAANNEPDKALADFDEAIRLDPKATLAYYHRANLAYGKGQYDKALEDYNVVIRDDPAFDWAYHVRGWIYYRKKDYDKALADYETAIKLVPTESVFYRDRGNIALARKDYDKALTDYDKSVELDPAYVVPRHLRGVTWQAKKEYAKALADYEKAVEIAGKEPYGSMYWTALALLRAGCPDDKVRDGGKAL
ncbi:MAG TPA: tetratricopeptide repeat protein, partial [Gemmataceae bacterium]|nr:tetratricopeptide repeat protein [Gemmataceae bacterium]